MMSNSDGQSFPDKFDMVVLPIFILLMGIGALVDLQFSRSVVDYGSVIGNFTAEYGEVPGYLLVSISLAIMRQSFSFDFEKSNQNYLLFGGYLLLMLIPGYFIARHFADLFIFRLLIALFITSVVLITERSISDKIGDFQVTAAKYCIKLTILVPIVVVVGMKALWGRIRFRDLGMDYSGFTPWYLPQGYTGNYSFPSGHSVMAWFTVASLLYFRDPLKRLAVTIIAIGWGITVALGRILIGAHYISDVTFSAGMLLLVLNYFRRNQLAEFGLQD